MHFSKPAAARAAAPAPPEEHNNTEPSMDAGILAFGTSVSVNDDLRRSIQSDLEEIDSNVSKIKDEITSEQKIGEELRKTRFHAVKEARSQHQVATENLEVLTMHQEILRRLQNTFDVEISACSSVGKGDGAPQNETVDSMDVEKSKNANLPPTATLTVETLREGLRELDAELVSWKESFKATAQLYGEQLGQQKEYADAAAEMRRRMQTERLEGRLKQLATEIQNGIKDKETELKRTSALVAHNETVLKRIEMFKKSELALTDEINSKQQLLLAREADAEKMMLSMEEQARNAAANLAKLQVNHASAVEHGVLVEQQLQEAEELINSREAKKAEREAVRAERLKLKTKKEDLEKALAATKESIEESKRTILKNQNKAAAIDDLREENDKLECERVLPGRSEYENLCKQKENLTKWIEADKNNPTISELKKSVKANKQELKTLEQETERITCELDEKQTKLEECKRILEDHKHAVGKELASVKKAVAAIDEESAAKAREIAKQKSHLESKKTTTAELRLKLEALHRGNELLKQSSRAEKEICDISSDHRGLDGDADGDSSSDFDDGHC